MPELSGVVAVFSHLIRTDKGRTFRGVFGPVPKERLHEEGLLAPVRRMMVPLSEAFSPGEIVLDEEGSRYLAGHWGETTLLRAAISRNFILFLVQGYFPLTRAVTTVEVISGVARTSGTTLIATVGALREPLSLQSDGIGIPLERYRYLMGVHPLVGDFIEGRRILRIYPIGGIYYVEAQ